MRKKSPLPRMYLQYFGRSPEYKRYHAKSAKREYLAYKHYLHIYFSKEDDSDADGTENGRVNDSEDEYVYFVAWEK